MSSIVRFCLRFAQYAGAREVILRIQLYIRNNRKAVAGYHFLEQQHSFHLLLEGNCHRPK